MAKKKHLDRLKADVGKWNKWRDKNKTVVPDLTDADLTDANLNHANLVGAQLSDADFRDADLCWADLSGANLNGAILDEANLYGVNLNRADLGEANLLRANLNRADLRKADLSGANLVSAVLSGAILTDADLTDANLNGAYLTDAHLGRADLNRADLGEAALGGTVFFDTDLKDVLNLESCKHHGSSTIDHLTLERSGMLPINFLRGCGLPEKLIEYFPSLLNQAINFYSCFISYSHADKAFARRLHDQLQGRGIRCWLDEHQLLPGDDIYEQVDHGIRVWDKVLLCASQSALNSWWVDNEINSALRKEQEIFKDRRKKVWSLIPLDLDGYMFDGEWENGKAGQVKSRIAANFKGWETSNSIFEEALENVVKALQTDNTGRETPPPSKL